MAKPTCRVRLGRPLLVEAEKMKGGQEWCTPVREGGRGSQGEGGRGVTRSRESYKSKCWCQVEGCYQVKGLLLGQ